MDVPQRATTITPVQDPDPTTNTPVQVPRDPTTNPVTVPGKRDWVAKFDQLEVAGLLKAQFGLTDITPRLARSVCGHMRRGTFTAAGLSFVLARLHVLPGEDNHIARRPESLEDLLKRFSFIRDHLTRSLRYKVRERIEREVKTLKRVESVVEQLAAFEAAQWCWEWKSYASFVADKRNGDRRFAWVASYYFHSRGEDVLEADGGVAAAFSCMVNPDVYDWAARHLNCDLADLTGVTKAEVVKLRATMLVEINSQLAKVTATSTPSFETLVEADVMGVEAQIARAIESGDALEQAA